MDDDDIDAKMAEIRQHPDVISVEQDGIGKVLPNICAIELFTNCYSGSTGYAINDPLAPQQWALSKLRAYEVWDLVRINPASNIVSTFNLRERIPPFYQIRKFSSEITRQSLRVLEKEYFT